MCFVVCIGDAAAVRIRDKLAVRTRVGEPVQLGLRESHHLPELVGELLQLSDAVADSVAGVQRELNVERVALCIVLLVGVLVGKSFVDAV